MTERYKRALVDAMKALPKETFVCLKARVFSGFDMTAAAFLTGLSKEEVEARKEGALESCRRALRDIPAWEGWTLEEVSAQKKSDMKSAEVL